MKRLTFGLLLLLRVAAALEAGDDGVALKILFRRYGDEQRFLAALTDRRLMRHAQVKPAALAGLLLSQDRDIREAAIGLISSLR